MLTFISVDNARVVVTSVELAQFKDVREIYSHADFLEGEEVLTFRLEELATQHHCVKMSENSKPTNRSRREWMRIGQCCARLCSSQVKKKIGWRCTRS